MNKRVSTLTNASSMLVGLTTSDGWYIRKKLEKHKDASGGTFSDAYIVEKKGQEAFLKAFDFADAFESADETMEIIAALTNAYQHERDILHHCAEKRLNKVVLAISHGHVQVPDFSRMEGRVYYLIFELAVGDVRRQINAKLAEGPIWCLQVLKDITLALSQIHREMIAHQDIKPSNVLVFGERDFKVSDFGRSTRKGHPVWYDNFNVAGDKTYAPPELLYGYVATDFAPRRIGCDMYMLGNLACYLFTGTNMTGNFVAHLAPQHHWSNWAGNYAEVLPYLNEAHARTLEDINPLIDSNVREFVMGVISELCTPDIRSRGDKSTLRSPHLQYSVHRYVARLDLEIRRATIRARVKRAS